MDGEINVPKHYLSVRDVTIRQKQNGGMLTTHLTNPKHVTDCSLHQKMNTTKRPDYSHWGPLLKHTTMETDCHNKSILIYDSFEIDYYCISWGKRDRSIKSIKCMRKDIFKLAVVSKCFTEEVLKLKLCIRKRQPDEEGEK